MPPIRLKDKYSEHFSLGTDEHDGTTTVDCHYCASKLEWNAETIANKTLKRWLIFFAVSSSLISFKNCTAAKVM